MLARRSPAGDPLPTPSPRTVFRSTSVAASAASAADARSCSERVPWFQPPTGKSTRRQPCAPARSASRNLLPSAFRRARASITGPVSAKPSGSTSPAPTSRSLHPASGTPHSQSTWAPRPSSCSWPTSPPVKSSHAPADSTPKSGSAIMSSPASIPSAPGAGHSGRCRPQSFARPSRRCLPEPASAPNASRSASPAGPCRAIRPCFTSWPVKTPLPLACRHSSPGSPRPDDSPPATSVFRLIRWPLARRSSSCQASRLMSALT